MATTLAVTWNSDDVISMQTARPDEGWSDSLLRTAVEAMLQGLASRAKQNAGRSVPRRVGL